MTQTDLITDAVCDASKRLGADQVVMGPAHFVVKKDNCLLELAVDPHDQGFSTISLVGTVDERSVRIPFDYLASIRFPQYWEMLRKLRKETWSCWQERAVAELGLIVHFLLAECPDLLSGDFRKLVNEERYDHIADELDWAFVPGQDRNPGAAMRHPLLFLKYKLNDSTWMSDYIALVITPKLH